MDAQKNSIKIDKRDPMYADLRFILKAIGKDKKRKVFTRLHVRTWGAEASNRWRLHRAIFNHDITPGCYTVLRNNEDMIEVIYNPFLTWPLSDKIWPNHQKFESLPESEDGSKNHVCLAKVIRDLPKDSTINSEYFHDAISGMAAPMVAVGDKNIPTELRSNNRLAIIASIKI